MKRRDVLKYLALSGATLSSSGCMDLLMGYKKGKGFLYDVKTEKLTYPATSPFRLPAIVPSNIREKVSYEFDILSIMADKPKGGETVKIAVRGPTGLKEMVGKKIKFKYSPETKLSVKTKVKSYWPFSSIKDKREIDFTEEGIEIDGIMHGHKILKKGN